MSDVILRAPTRDATRPPFEGPRVPLDMVILGGVLVVLIGFTIFWNPTTSSPTAWGLQSISQDGRTLVLTIDPGCGGGLGETVVTEGATTVRVSTFLTHSVKGGDDACLPEVSHHTDTVTLAQPLADRGLTGCGTPLALPDLPRPCDSRAAGG